MTNFDVIEAYVEDFTNWNYVKARGVVTISQHKFIITECILNGLSIVEDIREPYSNLTVRITGITDNQEVLITDYVNGQHQIINTITEDGIYTIEDRHHFVGFGIYSAMRNGFDVINATANKNAFDLYKYSRDSKDELAGQIGELKTELAVIKATRPYQDALIQCDIRRVAEHTDFNLWRRTCRMISGEVVLPNTPTVTGYASYNPCACATTTTTPTTAA